MSKKIIAHDGQYYNEGEPVWDLGSFECVDGQDMNQRNYEGLSADVDKLPKYDDLETIIATAWTWHKNHPNGYR